MSSSSSVCDDVSGVDDATNKADGDCLTDTTARLDADGGENAAARLRCRAIVRACLLLIVELDAMISGGGEEEAALREVHLLP